MIACGMCARRLDKDHGHLIVHAPSLPTPDYCRWCARPMSERARAAAPLDGFVSLMQALSGRRPAVLGKNRAHDE